LAQFARTDTDTDKDTDTDTATATPTQPQPQPQPQTETQTETQTQEGTGGGEADILPRELTHDLRLVTVDQQGLFAVGALFSLVYLSLV
jgi:hypothetical protein